MHKDLPSGTTHTVTVIDDLMEEMSKSKTAMDIFTKHSHHRNRNSVVLGAKVIRLHTQHEGHITECILYGTVPKPIYTQESHSQALVDSRAQHD